MRKRLTSFVVSGLIAAGIAVTGVQPASAGVVGPVGTMKPAATQNATGENVVEVGQRRYRRHHRRHHSRRHHRSPRAGIYFHFGTPRHYPRYVYPRHVYPRYVYPRHVYPRYQQRRVYRSSRGLPSAHVRWCDNRFISYRAWDNTFQPYNGPRKQCRSPYY